MDSIKYSSFLTQLSIYGFRRFCGGDDIHGYYHEKFLRGMLWIAGTIQRTVFKGRKHRIARDPNKEPRLSSNYSHLGPPSSDSPYWKLHKAMAEHDALGLVAETERTQLLLKEQGCRSGRPLNEHAPEVNEVGKDDASSEAPTRTDCALKEGAEAPARPSARERVTHRLFAYPGIAQSSLDLPPPQFP